MNFMFIRARYNYIQLIILQRIEGKARFLYSLPFPPSSNGMKWYAMILILIAIPADANFLNGYALNGPVLVGYVLKIRIGGICIGGIRLRFLLMHTFWMDTHWMDTHSMDTYWWDTCWTDTYWWDTYCKTCWCKRFERIRIAWIRTGGIRVERIRIGGIRIGGIRFEWICVGYVWCDGYVWDMCGVRYVWDMCGVRYVWDMCGVRYVWDMCGVRYANNLLKNPATKRLSGKKQEEISRCSGWAGRTPTRQSAIWPAPSSSCNVTQPLTAETNNSMLEGLENTMKYTISAWQHKRSGTWAGCILRMSLYVLEAGHVSSV